MPDKYELNLSSSLSFVSAAALRKKCKQPYGWHKLSSKPNCFNCFSYLGAALSLISRSANSVAQNHVFMAAIRFMSESKQIKHFLIHLLFGRKARKAVKWKSIKPTELETTEKSRELVIYDGASSTEKKLTQCNSDLTDEERKTRLNKLKKQNDAEDAAEKTFSSLHPCNVNSLYVDEWLSH